MTHIDIKVAGAAARLVKQEGILTDGMVGATVTFAFDGAWDGLSKMAVFRAGGVTRDQIMGSDTVRIPPEVLLEGKTLYVGVEGRNGDGSLVIPTVWVRAGTVYDGANASGDPSTDPTLPVWAQIVAMIGELGGLKTVDKSSLVEAINEVLSKSGGGSVDEDTIAQLVEEYLAEHPPKVTETDPTVPDWAKQSAKPSYTADEVGAIPVPEKATVGQTIVVKEVDENGKPVSWECVDVAGGTKLLVDYITEQEIFTSEIPGAEFSEDLSGNSFCFKNVMVRVSGTVVNDVDTDSFVRVWLNGLSTRPINMAPTSLNSDSTVYAIISADNASRCSAITVAKTIGVQTLPVSIDKITAIRITGNNYNRTHLAAGASIKIWGWD